ncbi:pentapeptide repeat-containing protein [Nocardia brasiliensis]
MTTIAAICALWFTSESLRATNSQYGLSQQTAVTDRFRLAAEQLASDKVDVRISGIYLLERLAKDSPTDHPTVFAVLSAFLRTHALARPSECMPSLQALPAIDVQTILTVLGRREVRHDDGHRPIDLRVVCMLGMDLTDAKLPHSDLSFASLMSANLTGANLTNANLASALLYAARFNHAVLSGANLRGARGSNVKLAGADLSNANLQSADLSHADLTDANLTNANLTTSALWTGSLPDRAAAYPSDPRFTGTNLSGADLSGANLTGANLAGANLADTNLSRTNLTDISYNEFTRWPTGFKPAS